MQIIIPFVLTIFAGIVVYFQYKEQEAKYKEKNKK